MKLKRLLAALALAFASLTVSGQPAFCVWCPTYKCFGPCGGTCRCVSKDYTGGTCVNIQALPQMLEQGYHEVTAGK